MLWIAAAIFCVLGYLEVRKRADITRTPSQQRRVEELRRKRAEVLEKRRKAGKDEK